MQSEERRMQNVMILFDGTEDDADLILVPEDMAEHINTIAHEFFRWAADPSSVHDFWAMQPNGRKVLALGTNEFIWYLNHHVITSGEQAEIVAQHIHYDPQYPTAYF